MEFRILGPLQVYADGERLVVPSGRQQTLLALLVVNANRVLSADQIADELWGEALPESGTKALAFHVSRLRDALAPGRSHGDDGGVIVTEPGGYVLRIDPEQIDAVRFERLAREAHQLLNLEPARARETLEEALALWRGDALAGAGDAAFVDTEARRLEELRRAALEDRLEAELMLGRHREVVAELEALLDVDPLREHLRCLVMLALYRCGRQAEALRVAGEGRRLLSEELGVDPSPELVRLETRMLAQDSGLEPPSVVPPSARPRNPYKGLRAFGESDSGDFFGREALVGRLVGRLEEVAHAGRLLVVVGPSGSGKSSIVRAGLVAAVRLGAPAGERSWQVVTMVPGVAPFHELAATMAASGFAATASAAARAETAGDLGPLLDPALGRVHRLLVVIDQFEELFVRTDERARDAFVAAVVRALAAPGAPLVVVATLRADVLHVPLLLPGLGERIRDGIETVTPLSRAELERAIARPAAAVGAEVEPGLVAEMISDVEGRPGVLPLLQYALTELFERSDGRRLTRESYAAIGGVRGALARQADEAWLSLDAGSREIAQQLLLRLVTVADGGPGTTGRNPRADLESIADPATVRAVLDDFRLRGLLTFDDDPVRGEPTVEIAHEALIAHWPRLAGWIEDQREDLWTRRRLADAAAEWEGAARSTGFLAAGSKLDRFEAWARGTRLRLTDRERAYLTASATERERLAKAELERAARERRLERRSRVIRRGFVGVFVAAVLVAGSLSAALFNEWGATQERDQIATARRLADASVASLGNKQLSMLLALQAADATVGRGYVVEEAYDALQWAAQGAGIEFPAGTLPIAVRRAPDGPRGVFLFAPEKLMRLGADYVASLHSGLDADQCRAYLHAASCPPVQAPETGATLAIRTSSGVVRAESLAAAGLEGTRVGVLSELPADLSPLLATFEAGSAIAVDWQARTGGSLAARIAARDLPDVAIVAKPSTAAEAARQGWLLDVAGLANVGGVAADAGPYAMSVGMLAGPVAGAPARQYAVPFAASLDDLLWYPRDAFAASKYEPPATPADLDRLVARLQADGHTAWCLGTAGTAGNAGYATSAWIEGSMLAAKGTPNYDLWAGEHLPFETVPVYEAFESMAHYVGASADAVGRGSVALTPEDVAPLPLVQATPGCWLYRGSSTDRAKLEAYGQSPASAVPFPEASPASRPALGRLFTVVVLHDRPEVRRFVETLLSDSFAPTLASGLTGAGIMPIRAAGRPTDALAASETARLRDALAAGLFRVRAVDLFPSSVATAFQTGVCRYIAEGDTVDLRLILDEVDTALLKAITENGP